MTTKVDVEVLWAELAQHRDEAGVTAPTLAQRLTASTFAVTRGLEELQRRGRVERLASSSQGMPVRWRASADAAPPPTLAAPNVVVLVDLGNTHDCLAHLVPLAEAGVVLVRAYADCSFAGYGVRPPLQATNCVVVQATAPDRNAADVELIWDVAGLCAASSRGFHGYHFLVATKDQGFRYLKQCVESSGVHSLSFVADWPALEAALAAVA